MKKVTTSSNEGHEVSQQQAMAAATGPLPPSLSPCGH